MTNWWNIDDFGVLSIDAVDYVKIEGTDVLPMSYQQPWLNKYNKEDITKIQFIGKGLSFPANSINWFGDYSNVTEILGLENVSTDNVTIMSNMFTGMSSLKELDVSSFDTSNVTNMSHMFWCTFHLQELDVSSFDTSKVISMSAMFLGMSNLRELDLSNFDTRNVTDMFLIFEYNMAYRQNKVKFKNDLDFTEYKN